MALSRDRVSLLDRRGRAITVAGAHPRRILDGDRPLREDRAWGRLASNIQPSER